MGGCKSAGTYCKLGHFVQPLVINNSANDNCNTLFIGDLGHVLRDSAQRYRRTVNTRHEQTSQYNFVEMGTGTASQETVQLQGRERLIIQYRVNEQCVVCNPYLP